MNKYTNTQKDTYLCLPDCIKELFLLTDCAYTISTSSLPDRYLKSVNPLKWPPKITNDTRRKIIKSMETFNFFTWLTHFSVAICSTYPLTKPLLGLSLSPLDVGMLWPLLTLQISTEKLLQLPLLQRPLTSWRLPDCYHSVHAVSSRPKLAFQQATLTSHRRTIAFLSLAQGTHTCNFSTWKAEAEHHEFRLACTIVWSHLKTKTRFLKSTNYQQSNKNVVFLLTNLLCLSVNCFSW